MTSAEMLSFWETGSRLSPLDRGVLAAQMVGVPASQAADLPLGERNRALARLYREHFGGALKGFTQCTECGEKLEFDFDLQQVVDAPPLKASEAVVVGRWKFRLPTSRALAMALNGGEETAAGDRLLAQCLAEPAGTDPSWSEAVPGWSEEEMAAIEEKLAEADALAEILIGFKCPECGAAFEEVLDLGSFLWSEVEDAARQLFDDIHLLASAYGWTEDEVLQLSAMRRDAYVRRVLG
ncbi:MAG: hypothetical protein ABSD59_03010 [Terracidiphilus sp.]|jgi:hypothetical protein